MLLVFSHLQVPLSFPLLGVLLCGISVLSVLCLAAMRRVQRRFFERGRSLQKPFTVAASASVPSISVCSTIFGSCGDQSEEALSAALPGAAGSEAMEAWLQKCSPAMRAIEQAWRTQLDQEQFRVLRMKGTEEIDTGKYNDFFEPGVYVCSACLRPLYLSEHKFKSGHGWPAFSTSIAGALDRHGKGKVEVTCAGCGGHIGHVFKSARYPKPHHERHCVNSMSLAFYAKGEGLPEPCLPEALKGLMSQT